MKAWKMFNAIGLFILFVITVLPFIGQELIGETLTYGNGLGDIFDVFLSALALILFFILSILKKIREKNSSYKIITALLYMTIILFFYMFTIGRGVEKKWNGDILVCRPWYVKYTFDCQLSIEDCQL